MSRIAKGPHLTLEPERRDETGRLRQRATWVIRDGQLKRSTGCGPDQAGEAQQALARYIAEKHSPATGRDRRPELVSIADVIGHYADAVTHARPREAATRLGRLLDFFGLKTAADITPALCRSYAATRGAPAAARRELEDLRAALGVAWRDRLIDAQIPVHLPEKPLPRERWLTRDEAARLIWAAWRLHEKQAGEATSRRTGQHVARFILVALYTGTRAGAVCGAAIRPTVGSGYVDLDRGVFYRKAPGTRQTRKRQPPVSLPDRLLAHLRRWETTGISKRYVVEWRGAPVARISKAFRAAREAAGLGQDVIPHTLRHTAATWLAMAGVPIADAADYLGMSVEVFDRTYRHHYPDAQERARRAITSRPKGRSSASRG